MVAQLAAANLAAEFSLQYEPAIRREFARQFPGIVVEKPRRKGVFGGFK